MVRLPLSSSPRGSRAPSKERNVINPEKVFDGKPCKHCGETLRWRSSRQCVECGRKRYADDPVFREPKRERSREGARRRRADPE
jgi:hypothetical protein